MAQALTFCLGSDRFRKLSRGQNLIKEPSKALNRDQNKNISGPITTDIHVKTPIAIQFMNVRHQLYAEMKWKIKSAISLGKRMNQHIFDEILYLVIVVVQSCVAALRNLPSLKILREWLKVSDCLWHASQLSKAPSVIQESFISNVAELL